MPDTDANNRTIIETSFRFALLVLPFVIGVYLSQLSQIPQINLIQLDIDWAKLEFELWSQIYGQDDAIQRIMQTLRTYWKSTNGFKFKSIILIGDETSEKSLIADLILRNIKCRISSELMKNHHCGAMKQTRVLFSRRDSAQSCIFYDEIDVFPTGVQCGNLFKESINLSYDLSREMLATYLDALYGFDLFPFNLGYLGIIIGTLDEDRKYSGADELRTYLEKQVPQLDFTIIQLAPSSKKMAVGL